MKINTMDNVWDDKFKDKREMWGWDPADSATVTLELFRKHKIQNILIPGFGYGRNAKVFVDAGLKVTGIEISNTAIEIADQHFAGKVKVHNGSVNLMPFDQELYDGIYCYALLHLLNAEERIRFIEACYKQLKLGGFMIFVSLSKLDYRYGQGKEISKDTFEAWPGVDLFFYDSVSIHEEFNKYGLVDAEIVTESIKDAFQKPSQQFWYIVAVREN
jgi:SAM-dependent methyltransferase